MITSITPIKPIIPKTHFDLCFSTFLPLCNKPNGDCKEIWTLLMINRTSITAAKAMIVINIARTSNG